MGNGHCCRWRDEMEIKKWEGGRGDEKRGGMEKAGERGGGAGRMKEGEGRSRGWALGGQPARLRVILLCVSGFPFPSAL